MGFESRALHLKLRAAGLESLGGHDSRAVFRVRVSFRNQRGRIGCGRGSDRLHGTTSIADPLTRQFRTQDVGACFAAFPAVSRSSREEIRADASARHGAAGLPGNLLPPGPDRTLPGS